MRLFPASLFIIATLALFSACSTQKGGASSQSTANTNIAAPSNASEQVAEQPEPAQSSTTTTADAKFTNQVNRDRSNSAHANEKQITDAQADQERAAHVAAERKIIRNADLNLELDNPADGQRKVARIAEMHGGFVVNSASRQLDSEDRTKPQTTVNISVRVPADQFTQALEEIRGVGNRVREDKVMGQDVTEEYFDLEARIKAKKALEAQFMEIMKQARSVSDALEVQSQLAEVRTEIERLEGRRRYLENQSSLSTITVTLSTPALLVSTNTTGFGYQLKRAFGGGVDIAASITLFLIQAALALLPVAVLIFLPLGLLIRFLVRRNRRLQLARKLVQDEG